MNLNKAIELLEFCIFQGVRETHADTKDAIDLGIEALKRIQSGRNPERQYVCYLLPGETED